MPNRILREGILTSERVNSLNWEAEVFYRRLMSVVDDFGRYSAHPSLLRAALYPLKLDTVRDANMERLLALVEQARLVRVYEVAGKRYLELVDFKQQVRAKESKFPQAPSDAQQMQSKCVADAHLDEGESGDGDETPHPPEGLFELFWESWPSHARKTARPQCAAKWKAKGCDSMAEQVLRSLAGWKRSEEWAKEGGKFIPAPLTWLNQQRWESTPSAANAINNGITVTNDAAERTRAEMAQRMAPLTAAEKAAADEARRQAMAAVKRIGATQ